MHIKIELKETSQPIHLDDIVNTYTKGPLFCAYDGTDVYKFPLANIWRVTESYDD